MNKRYLNVNGVTFSVDTTDYAWGDGEHHSTAFMLDAISRYGVKNKSVLDIGTGSGILSVLCGKLGAKNVLAVDIEKRVLECAEWNFRENNVLVETRWLNLTYGLDEKYDVILANLHYAVQFENVKTVRDRLKDDGILIMTWKNFTKFEDYVKGFEIIEHIPGEDYDGYVLKKKDA